eukprot:54159-Eustigmatos_ZCMA.PRE.1
MAVEMTAAKLSAQRAHSTPAPSAAPATATPSLPTGPAAPATAALHFLMNGGARTPDVALISHTDLNSRLCHARGPSEELEINFEEMAVSSYGTAAPLRVQLSAGMLRSLKVACYGSPDGVTLSK